MSPVGWGEENSETETDDKYAYTARTLFDNQAAASDEISFESDDIITTLSGLMNVSGWAYVKMHTGDF